MQSASVKKETALHTMPRGLITTSVMLATIMQALDMTIANVALPNMQGGMSSTQDQISWVLTSYIVASAIMTPPTGILAARYGRKRLFLVSVIGFTISSILCGAANSLTEIVIFRFLQGAFGAALVPLSQATLLDVYPQEKHGSAMAIWGFGIMVGPILGPSLGGYLTEYYSWRWVFYINVPIGIIAGLGIWFSIPETRRDRQRKFDLLGFLLLSLSLGALQLMLDRGQSLDWFASREIIVEALVTVLCLYMFVVHVLTTDTPFISPQIFLDRNFVVGLVMIFTVGVTLLATLALLPPFLQNLLGFPVVTTGYVLAPRGLGTMLALLLVGRLVNKVDIRLLIFSGLCLTALALKIMGGFNLDVSAFTIVWTGMIQGFGFGLVFVPLSTVTFATLPQHFRTEGTALFSLMRNVGSSIGISVVVTLLIRNSQVNQAHFATLLHPFRDVFISGQAPLEQSLSSVQGIVTVYSEVIKQSVTIAYLNDFRLIMWMVILSMLLLLLMKRPQQAVV